VILQFALRSLFRNPRRTFGILLTVALGTCSLYLIAGFNVGLVEQTAETVIHSRYAHGQLNTKGYLNKVYEKPWEHWITDWATLRPQLLSTPGISQVFPRIEFFALLTNGKVNVSGRGFGVDAEEEAKFFNTLNIMQGENLVSQPDGIVLGTGLARSLDAVPGSRVTILANTVNGTMNGVDLIVTGLFHTGRSDYDDSAFRMPLKQTQTLLDTDRIEAVALALEDRYGWNKTVVPLLSKLSHIDGTSYEELDKIYYQNGVNWLNAQFAIIQIIVITIVILGIFNMIFIGILERRQEIGNLRANGQSTQDVFRLLMLEGTLLGVGAAIGGVLLAIVLNYTVFGSGINMPPLPGFTRPNNVHFVLLPLTGLKVFLMGTISALFGTAIASARVVRKPIEELLRS